MDDSLKNKCNGNNMDNQQQDNLEQIEHQDIESLSM